MDKEKIEVDFRNLIKCALNDKIPWPVLKTFLDNMTTTLEKSKKVIDVLFEELQALNSRQISALGEDSYDLNFESQSTSWDQEHSNEGSDVFTIPGIENIQEEEISEVRSNANFEVIDNLNEEQFESQHDSISDFNVKTEAFDEKQSNQNLDNETFEKDAKVDESDKYTKRYSDDVMLMDSKSINNDENNEEMDLNPEEGGSLIDNHSTVEIAGSVEENISHENAESIEETELERKAPDGNHDQTDEINVYVNEPENQDAICNQQTEGAFSSTREVEKKQWQDTKVVINGKRRYPCKTCGQLFTHLGNLKTHVRFHTGEKPYGCKFCDKRFADSKCWKLHERIHTGELPFKCETCSKRFKAKFELKQHLRNHSEDKTFECVDCKKVFRHLNSLRYHMTKHHIEKLETPEGFSCQQCSKRFQSQSELKRHIRCHTGIRPFRCNTCGQMFSQRAHLQKHYRIHTGEKPYKCKFCEYRSIDSSNLKRHERTHTGEKPYQCNVCNKAFVDPRSLMKHNAKHENIKE